MASEGFDNRRWLEQRFSELHVGQFKEMDQLSDDDLEKLIDEIQALLNEHQGGVESNTFMDQLEIVVNRYIDG